MNVGLAVRAAAGPGSTMVHYLEQLGGTPLL